MRQIVTYGNEVLRKKAEPVNEIDQEVKDLVADMIATLKDAKGLGLAAPQVGESKRIFILDLSPVDLTEDVRVFINPEIIEASGEVTMEEGCLSFPGIFQKLSRPEYVRVKALDLTGDEFQLEADGILARAILHEYDHLDGKLFIDYLSSVSRAMLSGKLRRLAAAS